METGPGGNRQIRVLCIDDDSQFVNLSATMLEQINNRLCVVPESDPTTVLDTLERESIDCIISDHNMPQLNGLELLEQVRDRYPDLPFILFTGQGSEEIASEAIAAGVTDYLQKGGGSDRFAVLANRVENAVAQNRAERAVNDVREFQKLIEHATDVISIVDPNGRFQYLTPSSTRILGYEPEDLINEIGFEYIHPEDRMRAMESFAESAENPGNIAQVEFRFDHPDGWVWLGSRARNMVNDPDIGGLVIYSRDITERKERERKNERLQDFGKVVSHDLRNPLNVAQGNLDLLSRTDDLTYVDKIEHAHTRMEEIIEELLALAQEGQIISDPEPVEAARIAERAWESVEANGAQLEVTFDERILADPGRLQQLFENLFKNAIEHGGPDVTIRVRSCEGGFYVEDDGAGFQADDREQVFETGFSTAAEGTGFGLAIVEKIVEGHNWAIEAAEGSEEGARFNITGVKSA